MKAVSIQKRLFIVFISIFTLLFSLYPRQETLAAPPKVSSNAPEMFSCADFNAVGAGSNVEGLGTVHPDLNIDALEKAESLFPMGQL